MSQFIESITCDFVRELTPYESARRLFSGGQYWLNANESPFTNPYDIDESTFNRYPDCQPEELLASYARYAGVSPQQVLVSRGADEGIELLIRAFCQPGQDSILICPPTYGMYAISANTFNVGVQKAPLLDSFELDMAALQKVADQDKTPKLVFLCSPNNPTGTRIPEEQITQVLELFQDKSLVVVDEAYIEFDMAHSQAQTLNQFENLVILRTLSKAFALAGIRCGFTLASANIVKVLLKVIAPYPVSEPVAQIATQALSAKGLTFMAQQVQSLQDEKRYLKDSLKTLSGMQPVGDRCANFLLYRVANKQGLMDYLVSNGMLIRDQSKQIGLQDCLRITVGNREENNRVIELITNFYQTGNDQ